MKSPRAVATTAEKAQITACVTGELSDASLELAIVTAVLVAVCVGNAAADDKARKSFRPTMRD
jgi:hypothetical protein